MNAEGIARGCGRGREKRTPTGWNTLCPAHEDRDPSLSIKEKEGRVLVRCRAGCEQARVINALRERGLWVSNGNGKSNGAPTQARLTLAGFAAAKGFSPEFLEQNGITEKEGVLHFLYLLMNGQRASRQRIRAALTGARKFFWAKAEGRPTVYGLWRVAQALKNGATDLFLVEGETDALTLWLHGREALGLPGADMCRLLQSSHVAGFRRVFIVRENDQGGEVFEKGCVGRLAELEFEGEVAVIKMAPAGVKDPNELHVKMLGTSDGFRSEWGALELMALPVELPIVGLEVFDAAAVQPKPVEWIWKWRIPRGKLTLFVGGPGLGKSFVSLDVCARLSNGQPWPDGSCNDNRRAKSIVFSAEDGIADTIVVRLTDLGAERGHIRICRRIREMSESGEIVRRGFNLARDLSHLERLLDKHRDAELVVVDPVSAYLGKVDSHRNAELRSDVLDPLAEMAERRSVAIVAVSHFNKGAGKGLDRVSGSVAFPAAARQVWGFVKDPEDSDRNLMLFGKSNLAPKMPGLAFRIVGVSENDRATLSWDPSGVDKQLDDVLNEERNGTDGFGKLDRACEIIQGLCANGEMLSTEIDERGRELGISKRTMFEARRVLGCKARKEGFKQGEARWWIRLA